MPSLLTRLGQLIPGFTPRPTPPALVVETPEARADRIIAEAKQALDRSRGRPAPSVDEKVPQSYFAGVNGKHWFLPYHHSATADTPEIRAAMRLMIRDAYVKAAWEPLCIAVESEEWQVQPSESGNADAEEQAEFVTANFNDYLKGGVPALVHAIIGQLGPDGFGLAEKVWAVAAKGKLEGKIVLEAAKAKDPDNLHVKGDSFGNVTHVTSTRKAGEEFPITDFLYSRYPGMFDEPLGMAAFRASYGAYWMRDTVRKLRIMHTEKKMAGMLVGTYADGADDDKATLEAALRAAKSSTWMAIPEGTRVEAVQLSTASEPDYKSHEESLRDEIVTGIAFATLQTMTASVPGEGRGDSEVQKETSELAAWRLMSIVLQVVNEQLIPDLIDYNFAYPAAGGYPKLSFGAISKDEILKDQQVVQAAQQMGLQPSKKHYSKAWSVQLADPNDPDDQMQGAEPQPPMPPGGGFGGSPFGFSEGVHKFGSWQPYTGPEGGRGWTNGREVRYQQEQPDDDDGTGGGTDPNRQDIAPGIDKASRVLGGATAGFLTGSAVGGPLGAAVGTAAGAALGTDTARSVLGGIRALLNRGEEPEDIARKVTAGDPEATQAVRETAADQVRHAAGELAKLPAADPAEVRAGWGQASAKMRAGDAAELGGHVEALATAREPGAIEAAFRGIGGVLGKLTGGALRLALGAVKAFGRFAAGSGKPYLVWAASMATGAAVLFSPAVALGLGIISPVAAFALAPVAVAGAVGAGMYGRSVQRTAAAAQFSEWQPYTGPDGGRGWTNGREVRYQDNPPGEGGNNPPPKAPAGGDPAIAPALAAFHAATEGSRVRLAIDNAIANASPPGHDASNPPTTLDAERVRRFRFDLASQHAELAAAGMLTPNDDAAFVKVMGELGIKPLHAPGETKPFDPETMELDGPTVSSGTPVKVARRGWVGLYGDPATGDDLTGKNWRRAKVEKFAEGPADYTPAGPDGKRAVELLAAAKESGVNTLTAVADRAVRRLLMLPDPSKAATLFDDDELDKIAGSLAGSIAAADLLGRARVRRRAEMAERVQRFAESDPGPPGPPPRPGLTWKRETQRWVRKGAEHAKELGKRVKDAPKELHQKVRTYVRKKYATLEARYGAKGAKAIMAASVLMLPVPVPGASFLPIALAEAVRAVGKGIDRFAEGPVSDELVQAVLEFLAGLYADAGEEMPAIDPERVRAALERDEVDEDDAETFAEWTRYEGPEGGRGWKNAAGEVRYQVEMPGEEGATAETPSQDEGPSPGGGKELRAAPDATRLDGLEQDARRRIAAASAPANERYGQTPDADLAQTHGNLARSLAQYRQTLKREGPDTPAGQAAQEEIAKREPRYKDADAELSRRILVARLNRRLDAIKESRESGKLTVTEGEMRELLAGAGDAYRDAGVKRDGGRYPYAPDVFKTSDLTGAKIRRYVTLPDGRVAHPDELHLAKTRGRLRVVPDAELPGAFAVASVADRLVNPPQKFADLPTDPFHDFAEPVPAVEPQAAVDYFRRLVPTLADDPGRYGAMLGRHAFTLAVATEQTLLQKVKDAILTGLRAGTDATPDVQDVLDAAGVSPRNPQYAEMVWRSNAHEAMTQGAMAELQSPDMQDAFPIWMYAGIKDGRQGADHEPKFNRYYPVAATFAEVRGPRVWNCRCNIVPIHHSEAAEIIRAGKVESRW